MDSDTANMLILGVQVLGVGAALGWKHHVKWAIRRLGEEATARGYATRASSPQEVFLRLGAAEVGAVAQIDVVQRKTRYGTRDVEVITRLWHAQLTLHGGRGGDELRSSRVRGASDVLRRRARRPALRSVDSDQGFVDGDVFVGAVVDADGGGLRRGFRLVASVDADGAFGVATGAVGYGAMERRLGSRLVASAHDVEGLDALTPPVVAAILAIDAIAPIVSVTLRARQLSVFCQRRGVRLAQANRLAAATAVLVTTLSAAQRATSSTAG
jgi:hypothetical protein